MILAFSGKRHRTPRSQTGRPDKATRHRTSSRRPDPSPKVAITVRLDPIRARQLQATAENRSLTNYVETALIRDLALRDEASRVITMRAAPGTSAHIAAAEVVRADGESHAAYARRQRQLTELWSIPDGD